MQACSPLGLRLSLARCCGCRNVHMRDKNSALLEPYSAYHKATVMPHITAPPNLPERKPLHKVHSHSAFTLHRVH
jgi:hypothetical protein